jgi:hypothetical protein
MHEALTDVATHGIAGESAERGSLGDIDDGCGLAQRLTRNAQRLVVTHVSTVPDGDVDLN